jgi:hypothetical protein
MYRRLKDPDFKAAWRAARRDTFDDALGILEKTSVEAAQALRSALRSENITKESFCIILAATRVLDRAFKAQSAIAVEEELAELRELLATIKAGELPAPVIGLSIEEMRMAVDEQAEAARLRVAWMTKIGMDGHGIEESLRYNRPQTVEEEQYYLDGVRQMLEYEAMHEQAMLEYSQAAVDQ